MEVDVFAFLEEHKPTTTDGPFICVVYGASGSGKTSTLQKVKKILSAPSPTIGDESAPSAPPKGAPAAASSSAAGPSAAPVPRFVLNNSANPTSSPALFGGASAPSAPPKSAPAVASSSAAGPSAAPVPHFVLNNNANPTSSPSSSAAGPAGLPASPPARAASSSAPPPPGTAICSEIGKKGGDPLALLGAVGLNRIPAWLRPFQHLSNGEQARASLALLLAGERSLTKGASAKKSPTHLITLDDFAATVDAGTACSMANSLQKLLRAEHRCALLATTKPVAVRFLQPDLIIFPTAGTKTGMRGFSPALWPFVPAKLNINFVTPGLQKLAKSVETGTDRWEGETDECADLLAGVMGPMAGLTAGGPVFMWSG